MKLFFILLVQLLFVVSTVAPKSWNESPGTSVLLRDVNALTLYKDRYTTGRRSSPVPQLRCVGGSAGCRIFVPQVIQCINKGWDGVDVQWQCKADMDNSYRFGQIEVSCEGYSHPNDAYVLTGSCGLEYKLELTEEGHRRRAQGAGDSFSFFGKSPGTSVLLRDVNALTLYKDRYTTGRRSSPVPQLRCVGGSAGCRIFVPQVIQCINKGWDGVDVQWQCKADMDNSYRFGQIEVSCEGYSHPNDAYVLTGSCGLEYKLELTEEGHRRRAQGAGDSFSFFGNKHPQQRHGQSSSLDVSLLGMAVLLLMLIIAYAIYQIVLIALPPPYNPSAAQRSTGTRTASGFGGTTRR